MNILPGIIASVTTEGHLSQVRIKALDAFFTSAVIDTPDTEERLKEGKEVKLLFKESEVILAKNFKGMISTRNILECMIRSVNKGRLLTEVELDFRGEKIKSLITRESADNMELTREEKISALVKTNDIILSYDD